MTLTEGVWKISSFSRLLQDVCSAFLQPLLLWAAVTVTGCHGRGSDKRLPGSLSPLLCEDCIWMPVFVLLRVSECVCACVCVHYLPHHRSKGGSCGLVILTRATLVARQALVTSCRYFRSQEDKSNVLQRLDTQCCVSRMSGNNLSLGIKISVFFAGCTFQNVCTTSHNPVNQMSKINTEASTADSCPVLLGLIHKIFPTTDYCLLLLLYFKRNQ